MMRAAETVVPAYAHVRELRGRLMWCAGILLLGGGVGYAFRVPVIALLQRPLGQDLFYTSPSGSFEFIMRVCFLVGFLFALPVMVYHVLRFIEPALPQSLSRKLVSTVILSSFMLMIAGFSFGYFISLPAALHFFNNVGDGSLKALITADQYFTFVVNYLAIFAAVFQLPLLLLFINRIKPLGPTTLQRYRKFVIAGSFIVALFVPAAPDPLSQAILAMPIIVLYEVSIWLIWAINRRHSLKPASVIKEAVPIAPPIATSRPQRRRVAPVAHTPVVPSPAAPRAASRPLIATSGRTLDLSGAPVRSPVLYVPPGHIIDLRPSGSA